MFVDWQNGPTPAFLAVLAGLCNNDPGAGGAGGGGGSSGSNGAQGGGFSQEQLDFIESKFSGMVNAAITSRDKRFEKQLGERFDSLIQKLETAKPAKQQSAPPEEDPETGKKLKDRDIALQTIQRQLEEMRQQAEQAREQAHVERMKNRDIERRRMLSEGLSAIGITDPVKLRHALALLETEQRVGYEDEESDNLVWRSATGETLRFEVGLRSWSRSDDAKHFISPQNARGSGSNPTTRGAGPNGQLTPEQQLARLDEALRNIV